MEGRPISPDILAFLLEFEFDSTSQARYLFLPGLAADQDVVVSWRDDVGCWRPGLNLRWVRSDRNETPAVIDLDRLIHWPTSAVTRIRVEFTCPGEIRARRTASLAALTATVGSRSTDVSGPRRVASNLALQNQSVCSCELSSSKGFDRECKYQLWRDDVGPTTRCFFGQPATTRR